MNLKAQPRHPDVPGFSTGSLESLASALGRRAKAIKYRASSFKCTRELDERTERLNVLIETYDTAIIQLAFWSSGDIWLGVHRARLGSNNGWELAFTGRAVVTNTEPAEIVAMLEQTLERNVDAERLLSIWSPIGLSEGG